MAVTAARTRQPRRRHATTAHGVSAHTRRRTSLTSSIVLLSAASTAVQPAFAGLFGGGKEAADEAYTSMTSDIIAEVRTTLALPKDDETKAPAVEKLRGDTNMVRTHLHLLLKPRFSHEEARNTPRSSSLLIRV